MLGSIFRQSPQTISTVNSEKIIKFVTQHELWKVSQTSNLADHVRAAHVTCALIWRGGDWFNRALEGGLLASHQYLSLRDARKVAQIYLNTWLDVRNGIISGNFDDGSEGKIVRVGLVATQGNKRVKGKTVAQAQLPNTRVNRRDMLATTWNNISVLAQEEGVNTSDPQAVKDYMRSNFHLRNYTGARGVVAWASSRVMRSSDLLHRTIVRDPQTEETVAAVRINNCLMSMISLMEIAPLEDIGGFYPIR